MLMNPLHRLDRFAPLFAFLILIGLMVQGYAQRIPADKIDAYHARIKLATESLPYWIGHWSGENRTITESAQRLLKPNVILQRRYQNTETGRIVDILLVHCGYIRDMGGHYPPICYPASGWEKTSSEFTTVQFQDFPRKARQYTFERSIDGQRRGLRITNFFILPSADSPIIHDLKTLRSVGKTKGGDSLGVAQIQIVTDDNMPLAERAEVVAEFMRALQPAIKVIGDGIQ